MIIIINGEDEYRAKEKKHELITKFREKFDPSGMNVTEFQEPKNEAEIANAIGALPFLSSRRLITVQGLAEQTTRKADAELWTKRISRLDDKTIIVIIDTIPTVKSAKNKLYKALKEEIEVHEYQFPQMSQNEAIQWAKQQTNKINSNWSDEAIRELAERQSENTWKMKQEIDKISAIAGENQVEKNLIESNIAPNFTDVLFAFLDAIRTQNTSKAVNLMQEELNRGTAPHKLLMMLEREVQMLAELKAFAAINGPRSEREAARVLRIHPFVVKKSMQKAISTTPAQLNKMIQAVIQAEYNLKRNGMKDKEAVIQLVTDLLE